VFALVEVPDFGKKRIQKPDLVFHKTRNTSKEARELEMEMLRLFPKFLVRHPHLLSCGT
jgi:hypothetical protein